MVVQQFRMMPAPTTYGYSGFTPQGYGFSSPFQPPMMLPPPPPPPPPVPMWPQMGWVPPQQPVFWQNSVPYQPGPWAQPMVNVNYGRPIMNQTMPVVQNGFSHPGRPESRPSVRMSPAVRMSPEEPVPVLRSVKAKPLLEFPLEMPTRPSAALDLNEAQVRRAPAVSGPVEIQPAEIHPEKKVPPQAEKNEKRSKLLRKTAISFGIATLMGMGGLFLSGKGGKLGIASLVLQGLSAFTTLVVTNSFYAQAAQEEKSSRLRQFIRGAALLSASLFCFGGFSSTVKIYKRMFTERDAAPVLLERILNCVYDNAASTLMQIGFVDILGSLNFTRSRKN